MRKLTLTVAAVFACGLLSRPALLPEKLPNNFNGDLNGKMLTSWGTQGTFPGGIWNPHQFSVDSEGNLYIAEATGGRTQKFRPRPGADRSRLIGPPQALMPLSTK